MSAKLRHFAPRTVSSGASKIQSCRKRHATLTEMIMIYEFMTNGLGVKQPCRQKRGLIRTPAVYAVSSF
jgi:hypothetical protein